MTTNVAIRCVRCEGSVFTPDVSDPEKPWECANCRGLLAKVYVKDENCVCRGRGFTYRIIGQKKTRVPCTCQK